MQPMEAIRGRALPSPQAHSCQQAGNRHRVTQTQRRQDENAGLMSALHSTFATKPQQRCTRTRQQHQTRWLRHRIDVQIDERLVDRLNLAGA